MNRVGLNLLALFSSISIGFAQQNTTLDSLQKLDEVILKANTILGNKYAAQNRTGASYYLSNEELNQFNHIDISRALRKVPGVNFYEEDGFGLRPNISLRGTSPERSAKITLMEDGILAAPAPYSAPAAYYFPSLGRMHAVEILKGSSQIQYGPNTSGGAINMLSTPLGESFKTTLKSSYGSFNSNQLHFTLKNKTGQISYLVEYLNFASDGFKSLPSGANTGFDIQDVLGKIRWQSDPKNDFQKYLEFKYQYYDERSNETYLGLTQHDFETTPFMRYAASEKDQMRANHSQYMLTHVMDFGTSFKVVTNGYWNRFARNWYKLDALTIGGVKEKIATIVAAPEDYDRYYQLLTGARDAGPNALLLKANNRNYDAYGVQTKLDYHTYSKQGVFHDIEVGFRYHYDSEDRFQWRDGYQMLEGQMVKTQEGAGGSAGNRIAHARTFAAYTLYKMKYKGLTVTPGLRYEHLQLGRDDYGNNNPNRIESQLSTKRNTVAVFIPGVGINYTVNNSLAIFSGVHKGFSPPGPSPEERPEESINYELGTRFGWGPLRGEVIGFYNAYSNMLGSDLAASGGTGTLDLFNAGKVDVNGVEVLLQWDMLRNNNDISFPVALAYTYTNAIFHSNFGSNEDLWGEVTVGDRVPYIPQHQLNLNTSMNFGRFNWNLNMQYNGALQTLAGGPGIDYIDRIPGNITVDVGGKYQLHPQLQLTTKVVNLLNNTYAVATVPAGLRPGHPFGVFVGGILQL